MVKKEVGIANQHQHLGSSAECGVYLREYLSLHSDKTAVFLQLQRFSQRFVSVSVSAQRGRGGAGAGC